MKTPRKPTRHDRVEEPRASQAALARSTVYRRLPAALRLEVDSAILLRPKDLPTLEAIFKRFDLSGRGISLAALRTYARRLEDLARPAVTSQLLAAVFGCLPARYRRRVLAGTQVMLLSRVVQALSADNAPALSVAELARLGSVLSAVGRSRGWNGKASSKAAARKPGRGMKKLPVTDWAQAVRDIYGLSLPVPPAVESADGMTPRSGI